MREADRAHCDEAEDRELARENVGQVDTEVLADRMARVDAADRALLDARLGDLARHLEYGSEKSTGIPKF